MAQLSIASELTLAEVEERLFSLHRSIDSSFFSEAKASLPTLAELEAIGLDCFGRVEADPNVGSYWSYAGVNLLASALRLQPSWIWSGYEWK